MLHSAVRCSVRSSSALLHARRYFVSNFCSVSGRIVLTMAIGTAALASPSWTEVMGEDDKMLNGFGRQAAVGGGRLEVATVIVMT